jgi:hypothetical protein
MLYGRIEKANDLFFRAGRSGGILRAHVWPGWSFPPEYSWPWKESGKVRDSALVHDAHYRECVAVQAQYLYDTFGKLPATVPSIFILMYLQSHHLDLAYYDTYFQPGAYLKTHAVHRALWHGLEE